MDVTLRGEVIASDARVEASIQSSKCTDPNLIRLAQNDKQASLILIDKYTEQPHLFGMDYLDLTKVAPGTTVSIGDGKGAFYQGEVCYADSGIGEPVKFPDKE